MCGAQSVPGASHPAAIQNRWVAFAPGELKVFVGGTLQP